MPAGGDDDRRWPDPQAAVERRGRLLARVACAGVLAIASAVLFRDAIIAARVLLWPPSEPTSQWLTIVLVHVVGLLALPVIVGSRLGDALYDYRYE
jgi:hypothetical protein